MVKNPVVDLLYRTALRGAYRGMRVYWRLLNPRTHGALVAIWCRGEILLVQNSYVPYRSLPGGYVHAHETGLQAAVRELYEETGLRVAPEALRLALDHHHEWEGKREHVEIFELELEAPVDYEVDNREVIDARFFPPERALGERLFPPIREVILRRQKAAAERAPA